MDLERKTHSELNNRDGSKGRPFTMNQKSMLYRVKKLQPSEGGADSIYEKYIMSPTSIKKDQKNFDFSECVENLHSKTFVAPGNNSLGSRDAIQESCFTKDIEINSDDVLD